MKSFTSILLLSMSIMNIYQVNGDDCKKYKIDTSTITYFSLPEVDLSDRNYFPDVENYEITSASLRICNKQNGDVSTEVKLKGKGFPLVAPTTVWFEFSDASHPIFKYSYGFGPLAATTSAFTNGRDVSNEPNAIKISNKKGDFKFDIDLNYNPLKENQAPLINRLETISQAEYCSVTVSDFSNLCQNTMGSSGSYTLVGMEYLRAFDTNGLQLLDSKGNAQVIRSPSTVANLVFVTHKDLLTHGMDDGTFTSGSTCDNSDRWGCDDFYMLAMITLPTNDEFEMGNNKGKGSDDNSDDDNAVVMHEKNMNGLETKTNSSDNDRGTITITLSIGMIIGCGIVALLFSVGMFMAGYYCKIYKVLQRNEKSVHIKVNNEAQDEEEQETLDVE